MSVYLVVLFAIIIFSSLAEVTPKFNMPVTRKRQMKHNLFFIMLIILTLSLVAGFRWQVGTDYTTYANNYFSYSITPLQELSLFNEPGIRLISKIASYIYDDPATMFLLSSIITVGLSTWTIYKYSNFFVVSILLYVFIGAWHGSFNGIRQYLACAVLFAGHRYIIDKKFWKYLLIVLIASLFHISAFAMLLVYFVPRSQMNIKKIMILVISVIIALYSYEYIFGIIDNILQSRSDLNIENIGSYLTEDLSILRILVMLAPPVLSFFVTKKNELSEEDNFYINMLFVNAAIYIISSRSAYLARFAMYTNIYMALGFPRIFKGTTKKSRTLIIYISMVLFFLYWAYEIYITPNLYNFQWIFER